MPQMSPLSWINLMVTFITLFMIMNTLNNFSFLYKNKTTESSTKLSKTNWKW